MTSSELDHVKPCSEASLRTSFLKEGTPTWTVRSAHLNAWLTTTAEGEGVRGAAKTMSQHDLFARVAEDQNPSRVEGSPARPRSPTRSSQKNVAKVSYDVFKYAFSTTFRQV